VETLPREAGYIYAVGQWPRTFYAEDAKDRAIERARSELARTIQVQVKSIVADWMSSSQSIFSPQGMKSDYTEVVSSSVSDAVLRGSEVISFWTDKDGIVGNPATVYVLVRMPRNAAVQSAQGAAQRAGSGSQMPKEALTDLNERLERIR